jgi:hypothetical protein
MHGSSFHLERGPLVGPLARASNHKPASFGHTWKMLHHEV